MEKLIRAQVPPAATLRCTLHVVVLRSLICRLPSLLPPVHSSPGHETNDIYNADDRRRERRATTTEEEEGLCFVVVPVFPVSANTFFVVPIPLFVFSP
jgi:hypothetical protein